MVHIIQPVLGALNSRHNVTGHTKTWEACEHDQHCGENESIDTASIQRIQNESKAGSMKVLAMKPGLAKINETVHFQVDLNDLKPTFI
jgi:hypothetical protein